MRPLDILTWHVHGAYLYYLTARSPHRFHLPVNEGRTGDAIGRCGHLPWGDNVRDVAVEDIPRRRFDCIIYQRASHYLEARERVLSPEQRRLPFIYLEHDPPREHPTDTRHVVDDPNGLIVHVTRFNALMWDNGRTPVRVIEHGVQVPEGARYRGDRERGLVVINQLRKRGRRLGYDCYLQAFESLPLDLAGMESEGVPGGIGEILHRDLPSAMSRYRFFFNPIRYTSLGLAVCEAMLVGLPVVAFATAEMATVIRSGENGFSGTHLERLIECMRLLLREPAEARRLGDQARRDALERFGIERFTKEWNAALRHITGLKPAVAGAGVPLGER